MITGTYVDAYLRNRERSRALFNLLTEDAYYSRPIQLRQPIVFYDGHLPAFSFNTLVKRALGRPTIDPALEQLFARGIDPDESYTPDAARDLWPARPVMQAFVNEADRQVVDALAREDLDRPGHPLLTDAQAVFTILEHEAMHQETMLYMWHRLPHEQKRRPGGYAPRVEGHAPNVIVKHAGEWRTVKPKKKQKWVGYETTQAETDVLKFRQSDDRVEVVLEENPFYVESGGQVSDTGRVKGEGWELDVSGVEKVDGGSAVVGRFEHAFEPTAVLAQVDERRRKNIERNHTATHLVHAALRKILGPHVRQQGSVVAPDRLRFDFAHHGPIDDPTLARIEEEVNAHIWENLPVETREMKYKEAIAAGAMAFFTEKYGDVVRVVDVPGVSLELCGGTHVPATGQIALFRFTHETGAAAGVRRIEAVTGLGAYALVRRLEQQLAEAAGVLKAQPEHLVKRVEALLEENRKLEKRIEELLRSGGGRRETGAAERIGDVELYIDQSDLDDRNQIGALMDAFRASHKRAISVLFTNGDRPGVHVAVTDDLVERGVKAGEIASAIAAVGGGKGGGRPHFASAGAGDPAKLSEARAQAPAIVRGMLTR